MPSLPPFPHFQFPSTTATYITAGLATTGALILLRAFSIQNFSAPPSAKRKWLDSPRKTLLPKLSVEEQEKLAYPPNALPGARDIETPYGGIRVYEWGPKDGEKVLCVHGISTPCVAFGNLAPKLVKAGYRVMLFDLFGRGYTDAPTDIPYDDRLFTTQILLCLASSPIPWPKFHIIGYSLGGCLAANFSSYFPDRILSFVAIAPAGFLRYEKMSLRTRIMYSPFIQGLLPESLKSSFVHSRLYSDPQKSEPAVPALDPGLPSTNDGQAEEETRAEEVYKTRDWSPMDCNLVVNENLEHHPGLPHAFVSSLQYSPIYSQEERWKKIQCRILMLLGSTDAVIKAPETATAFEAAIPGKQRETVVVDAGHDLPISKSEECADAILRFYDSEKA